MYNVQDNVLGAFSRSDAEMRIVLPWFIGKGFLCESTKGWGKAQEKVERRQHGCDLGKPLWRLHQPGSTGESGEGYASGGSQFQARELALVSHCLPIFWGKNIHYQTTHAYILAKPSPRLLSACGENAQKAQWGPTESLLSFVCSEHYHSKCSWRNWKKFWKVFQITQ